mgnify:CR=1 FL=1
MQKNGHMADYRIVIADDHPLFRDALKQALTALYRDIHIAEAGSLEEAVRLLDAAEEPFDLVLFDLKMPGVQGLSGLVFLRAQFPDMPVVVVSATEDAAVIRRALDLGASGFIPKSTPVDTIRSGIAAVLGGDIWVPGDMAPAGRPDSEIDMLAARLATLTPQQARVLMMLREGLLNKQIAYELGVSEATVKAHVSAILQKLGVESRTQAVIAASRIDGEQWAS